MAQVQVQVKDSEIKKSKSFSVENIDYVELYNFLKFCATERQKYKHIRLICSKEAEEYDKKETN
ncbi:hypothetical protein GF389_05915 [Candidatus Dojkabacteria bacterium]|nr:hypothetical protein [Candidatus Dojkabacteria bacterium]